MLLLFWESATLFKTNWLKRLIFFSQCGHSLARSKLLLYEILFCVCHMGVIWWGTGGTCPPHFFNPGGQTMFCPPHFLIMILIFLEAQFKCCMPGETVGKKQCDIVIFAAKNPRIVPPTFRDKITPMIEILQYKIKTKLKSTWTVSRKPTSSFPRS